MFEGGCWGAANDPVRGGATIGLVDDYRSVNRASWDERAPAHVKSPWRLAHGYTLQAIKADAR
jgi:hypothetical protein